MTIADKAYNAIPYGLVFLVGFISGLALMVVVFAVAYR